MLKTMFSNLDLNIVNIKSVYICPVTGIILWIEITDEYTGASLMHHEIMMMHQSTLAKKGQMATILE